ncbi:MAG: hypothetical protein A2268_13895 [Candidatus Raymondbacteria bacterium RifOxyA12_full_50_37]|uniref:O-antigen ligase-related domain-containing protein n=1 Tax=Candidatus Raymondbacteria bacterium RIFOXYD12_FULL_49_13 TaxID=1817890 RepID=A0A1F7FL82_UNCRA|nr:MAG: hypothetical protein A2268_13895 [Candidatus Raymondbacteria bacterium RifOxyA12_full_50_37]OGJ88171.1 MAG: hypothetical protein A2248_19235 [Candidatus Raymondbacteria bacterium RIFOXYA2_FULL_49_16]OGJ98136.1 MAG: hypothetical protein A2350_00225 [Candidatus Raymondbacteria bacterium RifOxyB12_full_50_8]OGJ98417.1 MAG: hypothetical protein A2487_02745 [Candidatus Raymondbacteria bacterium RifOxyC12_full_50_8]OGK07217.1 MAG: hypothetical protein A2519_13900 [Candidatus Raymondbacteria b
MRTTSLQKAAVALLSVLFFLPPLIFWSGSFSIIDIKVFFVKILIAGIAAGLAVDWFINKRIHVTGLKSVIIGLVYGGLILVSYAFHPYSDPETTVAQLSACALFILLLLSGLGTSAIYPVLAAFCASAFFLAVYNITEYYALFSINTLTNFTDGSGASALGHKNFTSTFLMAALPFALWFAHGVINRIARAFLIIVATIILWGTVLTFSRGAVAALCISGLLCGLVSLKRPGKNLALAIIVTLVVLPSVLFMPALFRESLVSSVINPSNSSPLRFDINRSAIRMIREKPLFSHGVGAFFHLYPAYKSENAKWDIERGIYIKHAHNEYLEILVDGGPVLLLAYLLLVCLAYVQLFKTRDGPLFYPIFASLSSLLLFLMVTVSVRYLFIGIIPWFFLALPHMNQAPSAYNLSGKTKYVALLLLGFSLFLIHNAIIEFQIKTSQKKNFDLFAIGRHEEAIAAMNALASRAPKNPHVIYEQGFMLYTTGRFAEAETAYKKALAVSPFFLDAHYHLALSLKQQRKYAQTLKELEATFKIRMDQPPEFHINYAETEYYLNKWDEALETLSWMFKQYPDNKKGRFLDAFIRKKKANRENQFPPTSHPEQ